MGERIEVVNVWTEGVNLIATTKEEATARRFTAEVPKGSLTSARLRLADAAEAWRNASEAKATRIALGFDCTVDRLFLEALAAEDDALEAFEDALAALRTARGEG